MINNTRVLALAAACGLVHAHALQAQAGGDDNSGAEVFELSPFTVDATDTGGYYASQTLAGTRLNTSVKDIGASVQIVTKELMDDIGATSANELLLYTTSTEAFGVGGNFSAGEDVATDRPTNVAGAQLESHKATRVRGLMRPDLTRNFFLTDIPFDTYNSGQVEINRGANAILFGLGSPAGIINNTLNQAQLRKRFGEVVLRFSMEGSGAPLSHRASFDYNLPVIRDRLAVRVAALNDHYNYRQEPAHWDKEQYYAVVQYKPFRNSTIRANYEHGEHRGNRPDPTGPTEDISGYLYVRDQLAAAYADPQRNPSGYPVPALVADPWLFANRINRTVIPGDELTVYGGTLGPFDPRQGEAPIFFTEPNGGIAYGFPGVIQDNLINDQDPATRGKQNAAWLLNRDGGTANSIANDRYQFVGNISQWFPGWRSQSLTSLDWFDFSRNLLGGSIPWQKADFEAMNISLEQTAFRDRLGVEIAFDKQDYVSDGFTPFAAQLQSFSLDVNRTTPNGDPNPNFGRPFVYTRAQVNRRTLDSERENFRVTGFGKLDFDDLLEDKGLFAGILGSHVLTGVFSSQEWYARIVEGGEGFRGSDDFMGQTTFTRYLAALSNMFYIGPPVDLSDPASLGFDSFRIDPDAWEGMIGWDPGGVLPDYTYWSKSRQAFVTEDLQRVDTPIKGEIDLQKVESTVLVLHSNLLWDSLVTTIGYREDKVELIDAPEPLTDKYFVAIVDPEVWNLDGREPKRESASTLSYGGVFHVPQQWIGEKVGLSLHYSYSENFTPEPGRNDHYGNRLPLITGETDEFGFTVSAFDDRLIARVNWYTSSINEISNSAAANVFNRAVSAFPLQQVLSPAMSAYQREDPTDPANGNYAKLLPAIEAVAGLYGLNIDMDNNTFSVDPANPNSAIFAQTLGQPLFDPVTGDLVGVSSTFISGLTDTQDMVSEGMEFELVYNPVPNWNFFLNVVKQEATTDNNAPRLIEWAHLVEEQILPLAGQLVRGNVAGTPAPTDKTIQDWWNENVRYGVLREELSNGRSSVEVRKWRVNFVTNYRFSDGFLKGFSVGGGLRWQDRASIGYANLVLDDGSLAPDLDTPYFSPSQTNIDLFCTYTKRFRWGTWNVRLNVQNVTTDSTDLIPIRTQPDGTIAEVRVAAPRTVMLTNTIRF